ncbi:PREDICTED: uncharacterized protein LOC109351692 isoform X2 [Lupinus angustifolius]|uniref:uncharacterized protein LOC109351692 isoform X2 n=1 Tax=Lupinus angustifolius TaxID=3871 RepID=UPI00092FC070|nr:PREDICTED: uncharacterized protein LOC109351692 isoform X2 [Lupinus angustifolius]
MAIAGLHNVSVRDSSFLRESLSQSSRRRGDGRRGSTQSSLLQIWREIEDEHVASQVHGRPGEVLIEQRSDGLIVDLSHADTPRSRERGRGNMLEEAVLADNDSEMWSQSQSQNESHDDHEDLNNSSCENSSDLGEVERERVRQIFREWMNSGAREYGSNISRRNSSPMGEWLGETEQERVRIIREWVQLSSQQRGVSSVENRKEQFAEIDTQIERVRDGFILNQSEHTRRGIRKLCGRQVMLDMLKKAERERQREIQELLDHRAVSHFPHRNRIQALLRGRFLRNDRCGDNNMPTSTARSELGLLRQRQTVSGLREGFFSRKDDTGCNQATSNLSDTASISDIDFNSSEQTGDNSSQLVPPIHSEPNNRGSDGLHISADRNYLHGVTFENVDTQDSTLHVEDQLQSMQIESLHSQPSPSVDVKGRGSTEQNVDIALTEDSADELTQESLRIGNSENSNLQKFSEAYNEQSELGDIHNGENNHMEDNVVDDMNWSESNALQGDELEEVIDSEGSDWHQSNTEGRNSTEENVDDNHISSTANEWPENRLGYEDGDNTRLQVAPEVWQEDSGFQEAMENWFGGPSGHEDTPVGRIPGFYFPDDDNVYSVELRELLSRRSVSNLLHSSFRESLDQLIQSYVERQGGNAHIEWELQETTPSSASVEQDLEQQSRDQIVGEEGTVNSPHGLPALPIPPPLPLWGRRPHRDNWSQNDVNNQRPGMDWEVNDLRLDMARLHQRMNSMQRMLEACMDLQVELQRSIRQEVSAALNRSADSSGTNVCEPSYDESKWECVRKGICCICCESSIDSLLYRCGHLCTCLKCANELLQSRRKCPMCQAPVVEVIRAYSML